MAAKLTYEIEFVGDENAVSKLVEEFSKMPAHKWIPFDQIRDEGLATITPRQADWLSKQVSKKVKGSNLTYTLVEAETAS